MTDELIERLREYCFFTGGLTGEAADALQALQERNEQLENQLRKTEDYWLDCGKQIDAQQARIAKLEAVREAGEEILRVESLRKAGHQFPALEQAIAACKEGE